MREIKFKAWDTLDKKMRPDIFCLGRTNHIEIGSRDYPYSYASYEYNPSDFFKSSRYIPLQYTGLKDKNGVEIYEGDIVKIKKHKATIKYEKSMFILEFKETKSHLFTSNDKCEIIGNIYENKELLN